MSAATTTPATVAVLAEIGAAVALLEAVPDHYRVLRRFVPRDAYGAVENPRIGLFVDVEGTGLNADEEKVIQFGAVRFEYDREGQVGRILDEYSALEDPGRPLSPEVVEVTGLTDERLAGQHIDDWRVREILKDVSVVIAHNAEYDRKMLERRFPRRGEDGVITPNFEAMPWACSQRDVPWKRFGCQYVGLEYLLMKACEEFFTPHDALDDCRVGLHILAAPRELAEHRTPLSFVLDSLREPTLRVWAVGSPYHTKDRLRLRHYRWDGDNKCWWKDVKPADLDAERDWLITNVYGGPWGFNQIDVTKVTAFDRYSRRA